MTPKLRAPKDARERILGLWSASNTSNWWLDPKTDMVSVIADVDGEDVLMTRLPAMMIREHDAPALESVITNLVWSGLTIEPN